MSPSLTSALKFTGRPEANDLDIIIDADNVYAILYNRETKRIVWDKKWDVEKGLPIVSVDAFSVENLESVFGELNRLVGSMAPSIYLILPDPLFKHVTIEIGEIPKKASDLEQIIRWRLKEEFYIDTENMSIDYEFLRNNNNKLSIFCVVESFIKNLSRVLRGQNLLVAGIGPFSLKTVSVKDSQDSDLPFITSNDDYMSFGVYSGDNLFRLFESAYVSKNNADKRLQFMKRARREIVSAILTKTEAATPKILVSSSCEDDKFEDVFGDFDIEYNQNSQNAGMTI